MYIYVSICALITFSLEKTSSEKYIHFSLNIFIKLTHNWWLQRIKHLKFKHIELATNFGIPLSFSHINKTFKIINIQFGKDKVSRVRSGYTNHVQVFNTVVSCNVLLCSRLAYHILHGLHTQRVPLFWRLSCYILSYNSTRLMFFCLFSYFSQVLLPPHISQKKNE